MFWEEFYSGFIKMKETAKIKALISPNTKQPDLIRRTAANAEFIFVNDCFQS